MTECFAQKLLEMFSFVPERESLTVTNDFITGELMEKLRENAASEEEAKRRYHHQCLRSLDWSFNDSVVRDPIWLTMFAGAIEDMESHIQDAFAMGVSDPDTMRDRIPLDSVPFKYPKRKQKDIHALPKDDEVRIAFQALFLFLLRPHVPLKYKTLEEFLEQYPSFHERSVVEQERLKNTANWMMLSFYTIQPRNNKTFILNLIPRIVEGRNARYITGSGQTRPTADRVDLFRIEGNCEKIKRPPRRKKEIILDADGNPIVKLESNPPTSSTGCTSGDNPISHQINAGVTYAPVIIPYYQGFPNFSGSSSSSDLKSLENSGLPKAISASEEIKQPVVPFPGGIPIVMIPQRPPASDEESKKGSTNPLVWGGQTFPYALPQGVQLATIPGSSDSGSYAGGYALMMPQLAQAQNSPLNSPMPPVYFCPPQMFMKGTDGQSVAPFISLPIDYTSLTAKRSSSSVDNSKPSKKRKSTTKAIINKEISGLHRSSSVGSNEGGLEMLIAAAAGDLDVDTVCA